MSDESKADDTGPLKPQVIDLQAEEVTVNADDRPNADAGAARGGSSSDAAGESHEAKEADEARPQPSRPVEKRKPSRGAIWVLAALGLGLVGGGWIYRDVLSGYFPSDAMMAMKDRLDVIETNGRTVQDQLLAVSQASESSAKAIADLEGPLAAVSKSLSDTRSKVESFDQRIAAVESAVKSAAGDLDALRSAVAQGGGSATGSIDTAALAALNQRIDALEKDINSLKSTAGGGEAAATTAALSQALADLKAKIGGGVAFAAEFDRVARMVPAAAGLDVLAVHAEAGLPAPAGLAEELRAVIPNLPKPEKQELASDGGYLDSIWEGLSSIITIREIGEADWQALAEKCMGLAEGGDLPQAIALIDAAEGSKPVALTQWRDRAAARLKLESALDSVSQAVLRQISALGGAQ
ncbi:MAG: hypothetical protein KDK89_12905 [Alphaproteobacteria bacterium]|nr:hypothetical protein [Alphaproteobacteria bacterium]